MNEPIPNLAAVDDVVTLFETVVEATPPLWAAERAFHLLGEDSGRLQDQPKNERFFRQFDVIFSGETETGESYLPLERAGHILIMVGYLGSVKSRRLRKIIRQDEEQIAKYLLRPNIESVSNRPFAWEIVPGLQSEELGEDGAATIIIMTYKVEYVCAEV